MENLEDIKTEIKRKISEIYNYEPKTNDIRLTYYEDKEDNKIIWIKEQSDRQRELQNIEDFEYIGYNCIYDYHSIKIHNIERYGIFDLQNFIKNILQREKCKKTSCTLNNMFIDSQDNRIIKISLYW